MILSEKEAKELAYKALDAIEANPAKHYQASWRCETGMCYAGWVSTVAGLEWASNDPHSQEYNQVNYRGRARNVGLAVEDLLGLSTDDSDNLFNADNSIVSLKYFVEDLFGPRDVSSE